MSTPEQPAPLNVVAVSSRLVVFVALTVLYGCLGDPSGPVACTAEARPGVTVEVLDGLTSEPLADGSVLTLREGTYLETAEESISGRYLSGAWERAGTYEVRVDREGFVPWRSAEVVVFADVCHVVTVNFTAPMVDLSRK